MLSLQNFILAGDFNLKHNILGDDFQNKESIAFFDAIDDTDLFLLKPPKETHVKGGHLDFFLVSPSLTKYIYKHKIFKNVNYDLTLLSDHFIQVFDLNTKHKLETPIESASRWDVNKKYKQRNYKRKVGRLLSKLNWKNIDDPKILVKKLGAIILESAESEFGFIHHETKLKPWWNMHCSHLRSLVSRSFRQMLKFKKRYTNNHLNLGSFFAYKNSENKYHRIRNIKNSYFKKCKRKWRKKLNTVIKKADISSKSFWSAIGKYNFSKSDSNFCFDFVNCNNVHVKTTDPNVAAKELALNYENPPQPIRNFKINLYHKLINFIICNSLAPSLFYKFISLINKLYFAYIAKYFF